jgi:hypothetical protein
LITAIEASVGVMVGSVGPWLSVWMVTVDGLTTWMGKTTLTLGTVFCVALLIELFWQRTPFNPQWALPLAWAAVVAATACLTASLLSLIRLITIPKESLFGFPVGAEVGWGLWVLTLSSVVMSVTASIVATRIAKYMETVRLPGRSNASWTKGWRWSAIVASAVIAISGVVYFAINWENDPGGSVPSPKESLQFPNLPPFPSDSATPGSGG